MGIVDIWERMAGKLTNENKRVLPEGIVVQMGCPKSKRGWIEAFRPVGMSNEDYKKYLKDNADHCNSNNCGIMNQYICSGMDENGRARCDTINEKLLSVMRRLKVPCATKIVEVVEFRPRYR